MSEERASYEKLGASLEWDVQFTLSRRDSQAITPTQIDDFWDQVIALAESRGLDVGGGIKTTQI